MELILTMGNIIALMGVFLSGVSLVGGLIFGIYRMIRSVKTELDAYKLEVARNYVQSAHLVGLKEDMIRSEERMVAEMRNLGERFERAVDRMTKSA